MNTTVSESAPPELALPEFARAFAFRAPRLGLLLGAGASVSSGVPSAADLIWEFKRQIYATETGVHPSSVAAQVIPGDQGSLDGFFSARAGSPQQAAADEYAHYFERAYFRTQHPVWCFFGLLVRRRTP